MRTLSSNEINSVTGAGYSEDILTAAASIYVGSAISGAAKIISAAAFAGAANALGTFSLLQPLGSVVGFLGTVASPIMYFAAPLLVFDAIYPGVIAEKVEPYFN